MTTTSDAHIHTQAVHDKATLLYSMVDIEAALEQMAKSLTQDFADKNPVILCVMVGGLIPMGYLLTKLNFPLQVDYVHATRYQGKTQGGALTWRVKPHLDLTNRHVVVFDDILDGGVTLGAIVNELEKQGTRSIHTAVLVNKHHPREAGAIQKADYVGLEVEDHFIYGFGMDYDEYLRNIPGIYVVSPEHE